jgi:hypothetical protein
VSEDKKITVVEVTTTGEQTRVEAPVPKVKVATLGLTPEGVEKLIKTKQQNKL